MTSLKPLKTRGHNERFDLSLCIKLHSEDKALFVYAEWTPASLFFFQTAMIHWCVWAFLKRSAVCLFVLLKDTQWCVFNRTGRNRVVRSCRPPLAPAGRVWHCAVGAAAGIEHRCGLEEPPAPASIVWPESAHSQNIQNGSQDSWKGTVGFNERVTQLVLCGLLRPWRGDKLAPAFILIMYTSYS